MPEKKEHRPTRKKIEKVRQKGQVLKGPALAKVAAAFGGFAIIFSVLPRHWVEGKLLLEYCFNLPETSVGSCMIQGSQLAFLASLSVLLGASSLAIAVELLQVGWRPQLNVLGPRLERINPVSGLRRLFGGFVETGIRLPFVLLLAVSAGVSLWLEIKQSVGIVLFGHGFGSGGIFSAVLVSGVVVCLYAGCEYLFKRRNFFIEQSMSTQELRDEFKESDGDPQVKSMRQSLHEEIALQEMAERIKSARVIVVEKARK